MWGWRYHGHISADTRNGKNKKKSILDQKQSAYYITDSGIVFRFTLESGSIFIMNYYPEPDLSLA